jgi:acetylornithine deacetylase
MNIRETLAALVAINSISSQSNIEISKILEASCAARGMKIHRFPYRDERGVEKVNTLAAYPPEASLEEIELVLVGHTDTVPFDSAWTEATHLTERDGRLYGRGSCDTKGFIAAAITAATEKIDLSKLCRPLALLFTADEEVGCLGAKRLAEAKAFKARHAIVGEPTSLQPIRAGKGYCLADIMVRGQACHSAHPACGASAIFRAARLVTRIEEIAEHLRDEPNDLFDPPYTTLNVGLIQGGAAKNVVADSCRFTLEWRPVPGQDPQLVLRLVNEAIEDLQAEDADFDCSVNAARIDSGIETRADSKLVRALENASGRSAGTVAFATEAPQLARLGAEAVVFGPGDIRVAHTDGEFVPIAELEACALILSQMIEQFCA